jgi:predicted dinucleotide-binding enzyme
MKIAIIGASGVGSTLGHAWRRRGHQVTYGVPEPHAAKYASLDGDVTTNQQVAKAADVVVLCTPGRPPSRRWPTVATWPARC